MISSESLRGLAHYFESLVHDSARGDALTKARHQSFIASRLLGGLLALCVFPIYLVLGEKPSILGAIAFLWLLSPIGIAMFLSATGRFGTAHLISAANFAALITYCAWLTGGLASALLPWLVVVPLEAGLSTERRTVFWSMGVACLGLAALAVPSMLGVAPVAFETPFPPAVFVLIGTASAIAYAAGVTIMIQLVHQRTEHAIREGEDRYRLLAENANDMITRHDEKGDVTFVSLAVQRLLGKPARQVLGRGLFDHVHIADRPAYLSALSHSKTTGEAVAVEFRLRRSGAGETACYAWVEMRCRSMTFAEGQHGKAGCVVAVTRDISQHREQAAQLLKARDEAESASLAKTRFLASISHELRTPLNAIIGFSEILDRELFGKLGEVRYREYARLIHDSGQHLLHVVNDILDMSKIEAGSFTIVREPFEVASLVTSCCDIMKHTAAQKSLSMKIDVAPQMPDISADKRACKQMLLNVLSNAIKFTNEGGWVRITARVDAGNAVFEISDNGIGIAEKDLPQLGNPFVQANSAYDRNHEGAGLGLSVVKGLAQLHGGSLALTSTLGEGTTVSIVLPLTAPCENDETPRHTRAASAA